MNHSVLREASEAERLRVTAVRELGARGVSELLALLSDPSWVVRRAVVESLAALGDAAVEPLCELLRTKRDNEARVAATVDSLVLSRGNVEPAVLRLIQDPDTAVIADVAQVLGRRRSAGATGELIRLAANPNDVVAVAALEALGRIGGRTAVDSLIDATRGNNFFRTFPVIDILGRSGDRRVVEPLAALLANPNFLPEAARALGRTGERAALKPIAQLLRSSSDSVVRVAAAALWELRQRFEDRSGSNLHDFDEQLRQEINPEMVRRIARVMSSLDDPEAIAACRLFGAVRSEEAAGLLTARLDGPPAVGEAAAQALKQIGKESDSFLLRAIREGDSGRRKVLLPVVTRASAAADVAICLSDPDAEVRALACETSARLGNTDSVPALFQLLADSNVRVVHAATTAIQALGSREGRDLAVAAARSPSAVVRRAAVRILSYFGHKESLRPILDALNDEDSRVREVAIQGLPYLEDFRARGALFELVKSADDRTRSLALRSLGQLSKADEHAISLLLRGLSDADAWARYYSCQSLGRLGYAAAAKNIAALLHDVAGQVRVSAVEALSHLDSPEAHRALRQAAGSSESDVRRAAIVGLGIAHRSEDLSLVLDAAAASDEPTRLIALSALVNFHSTKVVEALNAAASDPSDHVQAAAIGFLSARSEPEATEVLVDRLLTESTGKLARAALLVPNVGRVAGLLRALETAGDELAAAIASLLVRINRPEARAALVSAARFKNVSARKAAIAAIAAGPRHPDKTALLQDAAANDPDPGVRQISALLLSE